MPVEAKHVSKECPPGKHVPVPVEGEGLYCEKCGINMGEEPFSTRPERRAYTEEDQRARSRTGGPTVFAHADKGLGSLVDNRGKDSSGRKLTSEMKYDAFKLRKWNTRAKFGDSESRNLAEASVMLDKLSDELTLPKVVTEEGAVIYRRALGKKLVRGRSIDTMSTASLYAACRVHGCNRTLKQFSAVARIGKKDIARCYRLLFRELDMHAMPLQDPTKYVGKLVSEVGADPALEAKAIEVLHAAIEKGITAGKDPNGLAGAALYIACYIGKPPYARSITQKEIARFADVTEVTIRNRYKQINEVLGLF